MEICPECGTKIATSLLFCPFCETRVTIVKKELSKPKVIETSLEKNGLEQRSKKDIDVLISRTKKQVSRPVEISKIKAVPWSGMFSLTAGSLFSIGVFTSFGVFVPLSGWLFLLGFLFLFIGTCIKLETDTSSPTGLIMFIVLPFLCLIVMTIGIPVGKLIFGPISTAIAVERGYYLMFFSLCAFISCGLIYICALFS